MDNTKQIEYEIADQKRQLERSVAELKDRVEDAVDWKKQYHHNTGMALGIAFTGGLLAAALLTQGSARRPYATSSSAKGELRDPGPMAGLWKGVTLALAGVAGEKIREVVDDVVPGFSSHYDRVVLNR